MLLPETALAEKRTPFTATQQPSWLASVMASEEYVLDRQSTLFTCFMDSTESRVAGSGSYSMCAVDLKSDAPTYWGELRISNEGGDWKGFWTGDEDGFTATLEGSGEHAGLVSRWTAPFPEGDSIEWSGYIVENGPREVPFKISGWRAEDVVPIAEGIVKAALRDGAGEASHIGGFKDLKETGLMNVASRESWGMGTSRAANGDLFTWVSRGVMISDMELEFQIFFAGGTGRFEHAVGSIAGQANWATDPPSYQGTGTIRY